MTETLEYNFDYDGYGRERGERDAIVAEATLALQAKGKLSREDEIVDVTVRGGTNVYSGPVEVTIE